MALSNDTDRIAERVNQPRFGISLKRYDAILLVCACTSQLFLWSVNPWRFDTIDWLLACISFVCMALLLRSVYVASSKDARVRLIVRILAYFVLFNIAVAACCYAFGGFISILAGIVLMLSVIKIPIDRL